MVLLLPRQSAGAVKATGLVATALQLALAVWVFVRFQAFPGAPHREQSFQLVEKLSWISLDLGALGRLQIHYFLGVDGMSISLVLLAGIVLFIGALSSWSIKENLKGYFALYLLLAAAVMGCFVALDFFLFYLFFEFMLLPMYFLIGMWGGPRREYAAIKFFLYTLLGSVLILVGMIALYLSVMDPAATLAHLQQITSGIGLSLEFLQNLLAQGQLRPEQIVHSFSLVDMADPANLIPGSPLDVLQVKYLLGYPLRTVMFLLLFIGFAIKLPAVPLHTWLPDAHVEAPTPVSVVLAGVLLKVGAYGLLRVVFPLFPDVAVSMAAFIGGVGVLSIIYGAFCALAQKDLKKLIAYSSVSHMGFVLLGLASFRPEGVNGAVFQLFSHGLIAAMLFLVAGVLYDRTHDRLIRNYRGLAQVMPRYAGFTTVAFFAALGLPGFSGFIAELLVLMGGFSSGSTNGLLPRWLPALALFGLLLGAAYALWTIQRMFMGPFWHNSEAETSHSFHDLSKREKLMLIPLTVLIILFGLMPGLLLDQVAPAVQQWVQFCLVLGQEGMSQ